MFFPHDDYGASQEVQEIDNSIDLKEFVEASFFSSQ